MWDTCVTTNKATSSTAPLKPKEGVKFHDMAYKVFHDILYSIWCGTLLGTQRSTMVERWVPRSSSRIRVAQ